jgi:hypothetical protein
MSSEKFIRDQIRRILTEKRDSQSEQRPKRRSRKNLSSPKISLSGALAEVKPAELIKKLKITGAEGKNPIERTASVLNIAIRALREIDELKRVYGSVAEDEGKIRVPSGALSSAEALEYINHILIASKSAGILTDGVGTSIDGSDVVIEFDDQ